MPAGMEGLMKLLAHRYHLMARINKGGAHFQAYQKSPIEQTALFFFFN